MPQVGPLRRLEPPIASLRRNSPTALFRRTGPLSELLIDLDRCLSVMSGTHSLRRTKATLIYRRTGNLRAVQLGRVVEAAAVTECGPHSPAVSSLTAYVMVLDPLCNPINVALCGTTDDHPHTPYRRRRYALN